MAAPPAFQFYARDWYASTRMLGVYGRGIYIDLLALEWENGPLDDDPESIAELVGADPEQVRRLWPKLRAKFTDEGAPFGKMINRRLEEVRSKQAAAHESRVLNGYAGALKRHGPRIVKP